MTKKEQVFHFLAEQSEPMSASELAQALQLDRTNASRYLNELVQEHKVMKTDERPVKYSVIDLELPMLSFRDLIGVEDSLKNAIQKAKAAILYPPHGLPTLLFGETGTGKTLFAECMYQFALEANVLDHNAPFITFNCADYAQNPQLLFAHIFGVYKGAYTDAKTQVGLVAQADKGLLFLDEIHRLPPEGQEMLFTFIDKGSYRPLGAQEEHHATVQIIGATTETSSMFLETFTRRIPMQIELPPLAKRTLHERFGIIEDFLQQEANRLNKSIEIDRQSVLAFLTYETKGNVGQLKRDLKLVCAKAFLHFATNKETMSLQIEKNDLPLAIQKGLLRLNDYTEQLNLLVHPQKTRLLFEPGETRGVWSQDQTAKMDVYQTITYTLDTLEENDIPPLDLEQLIEKDVEHYFDSYIEDLSHSSMYQEIISSTLWELVNQFFDQAQEKFQRSYSEKNRFAFALHVQAMIERLRQKKQITYPDLNGVRRKHLLEFQLAMEIALRIEESYQIDIPLDEIGFLTMFFVEEAAHEKPVPHTVAVMVIMHGESTASSMLKTAQTLLGTTKGMAFDMPLQMKTEQVYQVIQQELEQHQEYYEKGIIFLTDMGSPNTFSQLIAAEYQIPTATVAFSSTMLVIESLRMTSAGRSVSEISQSIRQSLLASLNAEDPITAKKAAILVTCYTGAGVAKLTESILTEIVDPKQATIITLPFLDQSRFDDDYQQIVQNYQIIGMIGTRKDPTKTQPFLAVADFFDPKIRQLFFETIGITLQTQQKADQAFDAYLQLATRYVKQLTHYFSLDEEAQEGLKMHIAAALKRQQDPEWRLEKSPFLELDQAIFDKITQLNQQFITQYEQGLVFEEVKNITYLVQNLQQNS